MIPAQLVSFVAEYIFGAQHAFVVGRLYDDAVPTFTAHAAAVSLSSSREDLILFILNDLVSVGLLSVSAGIFSLVPVAKVHKAVQAVPDGHLLEVARG